VSTARRRRDLLERIVTPVARGYVRHAQRRPGRDAVWSLARRAGLHERPRPFTARTRHGFRIAGDQRAIMPRCLYWFGHWEPLLTRWVRSSLGPGDTFLDVGANIGYFTMLAARAVGPAGTVVALEPSPATRRVLEANLRRNDLRNVRVVAAAAGATEDVIPLYRAPWNDAESSTIAGPGLEHEADVRSVPALSLLSDDELARLRVVKVDVEGAEAAVLEGIRRSADTLPPQADFAVEVHPDVLQRAEGRSVRDLVAAFEPFGYRPSWLPVDFSEAAHLHTPATAGPRSDEVPADQLVHLILSRSGSSTSGSPRP
jgi:FkbM family methyltransferase